MKNNWQTKKCNIFNICNKNNNITTKKAKKELLNYEIFMFNATCEKSQYFKTLDRFNKNLLIESLALHTRVLVEFFYIDDKKYSDDLIAQDLLPLKINWKKIRPEKSEILKKAENKANKQLAHMSLCRECLKRKDEHRWDFQKIKKDMDKIIEIFSKNEYEK